MSLTFFPYIYAPFNEILIKLLFVLPLQTAENKKYIHDWLDPGFENLQCFLKSNDNGTGYFVGDKVSFNSNTFCSLDTDWAGYNVI